MLLNYAALSFAVVITLWGAARIARRLEELAATTASVLDDGDETASFREMNSVVGPIVAAAATAIAFGLAAVDHGWTSAGLRGDVVRRRNSALDVSVETRVAAAGPRCRLERAHLRPDAIRVDPNERDPAS